MVLMGINRIVVTDGRIPAKVMYDFQARDNFTLQRSATKFDYAKGDHAATSTDSAERSSEDEIAEPDGHEATRSPRTGQASLETPPTTQRASTSSAERARPQAHERRPRSQTDAALQTKASLAGHGGHQLQERLPAAREDGRLVPDRPTSRTRLGTARRLRPRPPGNVRRPAAGTRGRTADGHDQPRLHPSRYGHAAASPGRIDETRWRTFGRRARGYSLAATSRSCPRRSEQQAGNEDGEGAGLHRRSRRRGVRDLGAGEPPLGRAQADAIRVDESGPPRIAASPVEDFDAGAVRARESSNSAISSRTSISRIRLRADQERLPGHRRQLHRADARLRRAGRQRREDCRPVHAQDNITENNARD